MTWLLYTQGQAAGEHFCDICGSPGTEYNCSQCDFDMCGDCWEMSGNAVSKVLKLSHSSMTETVAMMRE